MTKLEHLDMSGCRGEPGALEAKVWAAIRAQQKKERGTAVKAPDVVVEVDDGDPAADGDKAAVKSLLEEARALLRKADELLRRAAELCERAADEKTSGKK